MHEGLWRYYYTASTGNFWIVKGVDDEPNQEKKNNINLPGCLHHALQGILMTAALFYVAVS